MVAHESETMKKWPGIKRPGDHSILCERGWTKSDWVYMLHKYLPDPTALAPDGSHGKRPVSLYQT